MSDEMTDRESAYVFAELAYPIPDTVNAEQLRSAYVAGWQTRMRRDEEYGLADRIEYVLSDEWLRGRVLPCMVGAENNARIREIQRLINEYFGRLP